MSYYYAPSPRYRTACLEALRPLGVDLLAAICDQMSPARVMGPPFCHEYGTGCFRSRAVW